MNTNEHNFDNDQNLPPLNGGNPFELPSDYFASFEKKLVDKMEREMELSEFPLLSSIIKSNSFSLPENYFQIAEQQITSSLELVHLPHLQAIKKQPIASLSAEYVNEFEINLRGKIDLVDELKDFKVLYSLNKTNLFCVPASYFDELPLQIKDRIHSTHSNKISLIDTILDFVFGKKMALAFSVILVVGLSVFFYQKAGIIDNANDCKTLACLEKNELLNDNSVSGLNDEQIIDLVNINTLQLQLQSNEVDVDSLQEQEFILENTNTDQLIENL